MPFHQLQLTEELGSRPSLAADESLLYEQPLTWLWSGSRITLDREGRGTLLLTSRRVLFLSDEDPENRSVGWNYSDFSLHATSTSRIEWPHQFLMAKIAPAESAEEEEGQQEQKQTDAPPMWTRRSKRSAPAAEDDPYSDSEDAAVVPDAASSPSATAVAAAMPAAAAAASPSALTEIDWEDRVVDELRFVPSKPEQLKLMYSAWNRGDDLNTSDTDEADDDEEAKHDAATAPAAASSVAAVPADLSLSASIPVGRSPAPSAARQAMLRRLDRMLVVAPVVPSANPLPLPVSPPDSPNEEEELDPYAGFVFAPPAAASAAVAAAFAAAAPASPAPAAAAPSGPLRSCSSCLVDRHESDYSGAQLKKKSKRVCKRCVARKEGLDGPTIMAAAQQPLQPRDISYAGAGTGSLPSQAVQPSSSAALFASIIATATRNLEELKMQPE